MTHLDDRPGRRRAAYLALALTIAGLAAALTGQAQSNQRSFVWKAAGPRGSVYLVGSVHLLTKDYYPLSAALEAAFADSDLLVEEVDLGEMLKPESQLQTMARGLLPSGQSLDKVVSAETMRLVSQRASSLGLPIEPLKRFKPWSLALMLLGAEWQKSGFDPSLGLDRHFYDQARSQGKAVKGLETVEFQLSRFDEMSGEQQERLLVQSLKEADTQRAAVTLLADAWKAGDVATIEGIVLKELKEESRLYERLLVERNRMWLPQIESLFLRPRPALVVVGAAHLVGPDGLLAMLTSKGYTVIQQ
jgi:uncharacterized protein YbaP (TraB family)